MTQLPPALEGALDPRSVRLLDGGWRLARTAPGECDGPEALARAAPHWREAEVPGTVASAIHGDVGEPGDYDAHDWWFRTAFARPGAGERHYLRFDGLATIAEAWLNGERILASRNMFLAHCVDVTHLVADSNELVIAFRALDADLALKRPRPRWKTRLVERQALRWARTTLLGRIPAWTPAIAPVGPWQPVVLESVQRVDVRGIEIDARLEDGRGHVRFSATVQALAGRELQSARLRVGDAAIELDVTGEHVRGDLLVDDPELWWPHTHGEPRLVACRLELVVDGEILAIGCGSVGFREIALDTAAGAMRFVVNGAPVFCRGAVWTTADILRLRGSREALRAALLRLRDAGANMVRVGGTMAYESDDFYDACDELGILVWQDFMFANMDYPIADPAFRATVEAEARQQVGRLARHPCLAAWCGGSEVAQQAAMNGLPAEAWGGELFERLLPAIVAERLPRAPYLPSTPWGGALPMHVATGVSHYYGVGAYRRPLSDVKSARVKFAAECLGFSNIADGTPEVPPHHPQWKARVPRDNGAGYDFEDVRDHYLRELFGRDAVDMRATDLARYYACSRVTSGEAMARTYSEWRAPASGCGGALVWFHRDLWPGPGWGIVAADGTPKAPYWYLKRAWQPVALRITDEGLDGLALHIVNEGASPIDALVSIEMLQDGRASATKAQAPVRVAARDAVTLSADALLGHFTDANHAYRFGPAKFDVVAARLTDAATGALLSEDFHFPAGLDLPRARGATLEAGARWDEDGTVLVRLRTDTFLQAVAIECEDFEPDDNYFHLAPGAEREVLFTRVAPGIGHPPTRVRQGVVAPGAAIAVMDGGPIPRQQRFEAHFESLNGAAATARAQRPPGGLQR